MTYLCFKLVIFICPAQYAQAGVFVDSVIDRREPSIWWRARPLENAVEFPASVLARYHGVFHNGTHSE